MEEEEEEEEDIFSVHIGDRLNQCVSELTLLHDDVCINVLHDDVCINEVKQLQNISKKQIWNEDDKHAVLNCASSLLLLDNCYRCISSHFSNILPELFLRATEHVQHECGEIVSSKNVSALINLSLKLYCNNSLLKEQISQVIQWISKHFKTVNNKDEEIILIPYLKLLALHCSRCNLQLEQFCDIKYISSLINNTNSRVKWYAVKVLAIYLNVRNIEPYVRQHFDDESFNRLILEDNINNDEVNFLNKSYQSNNINSNDIEDCSTANRGDCSIGNGEVRSTGNGEDCSTANGEDRSTGNRKYLKQRDFQGNYLPVSNMLLEYKNEHSSKELKSVASKSVVLTKSVGRNLKSLSLGVFSGMPVLLSGEIGCGKTMLVEYLASCLGRDSAPNLLKLQLGDQTDSKSLLGTYICSERPGEFQWKPGTLTQAVQKGSWLLLEDIDTAPPDVISTLIPMIKSKCLMIPGHGEEIKIAPGFQIFATMRTDCSGGLRNQSSLHLFTKLCHHISMEVPTKDELRQIVEKRFPNLSNIVFKMVDIYCMVSMDTTLHCEEDVLTTKLPVGTRCSSPRDLFKWCSRISHLYHLSDGNITNEEIFLNAMQCFCSSIPSISDRSLVAYSVGAKLGLTKEKVGYYLTKYRPNLVRDSDTFEVGSTRLVKKISRTVNVGFSEQMFSFTRHSLRLLEDIAVSVKNNEPVLLVGETGVGKTSCIQLLAEQCGRKVTIINMSQQSDIVDLLGGFKPMDTRQIVRPLKDKFEKLFVETYSQKQNAKFLGHVNQCFTQGKWTLLVKLLKHCCAKAVEKGKNDNEDDDAYRERKSTWKCLKLEVIALGKKIAAQDGLVFNFVEGSLVKSIQNGDWILLDEINLATAETLEYLSGLLDSQSGSMILTERGDIKPITRHENFRLFACMNPATDIGKKDLPFGIRNRFTEVFVDEMTDVTDLKTLVAYYLKNVHVSAPVIDGLVKFYLLIKERSKEKLVDASGNRPHYSLRTLCRGLEYAITQTNGSPLRALYEGLCMSFLTQLDRPSHPLVVRAIRENVFASISNISSILSQALPKPLKKSCVNVEGYWLNTGTENPSQNELYVLTKSVRENLKDLARVVSGGKYPVLLQGETSVGKTSLISYLSTLTGNLCVRINNHEHTDIQEYVGCYGVDDNGRLVFKEGVLVSAMRKGYWIVLDELNLAPTDVLEALNRLLDDNRELFIAETQETVKAHPGFMLFATQNPPGHYGGRKILSRAFRNRFIELHFGEIPSNELEEILHKRCDLPISYCKKFVKVMLDLQVRRRNSGIFAGKHSFMTLRDLFRWAERYRLSEADGVFHDWEQCICEDGFMLIGGRCRRDDERMIIKDTLERNFKKSIKLENLYTENALLTSLLTNKALSCSLEEFKHIVWTENMKRLFVLVQRASQFGEAVLLVGDTGCGKTTVCQLLSVLRETKLYSVNCHMHTESADFLGGLRPVRSRESGDEKLFEWCDGPLVESMCNGDTFLIDEISLADDSVLERLNSVLEVERMLVLSEKGEIGNNEGKVDIIQAAEKFRLLATMNPGGDFGKKELSPALRNRFTEIWCPPSDSYEDLKKIIEHNIKRGLYLKTLRCEGMEESGFGLAMMDFVKWFKDTEIGQRFVISIRDLLSWVQFINCCCRGNCDEDESTLDTYKQNISPEEAYVHGCCLVFIDSIGSMTVNATGSSYENIKSVCVEFLKKQVCLASETICNAVNENIPDYFGIHPFFIERGPLPCEIDTKYSLGAETTRRNALRILRGMQLSRPILLEGSPGVGKTSLVMAIARIAGYSITRINLSEETDVSDLFGADLPVEDGQPGQFAWRDGPLLKALKAGHWVVFDEMNLASQSVLEGLNSCFDHRAEVFVPELNKSFHVQKDKTRIFACQNPLKEGGGRKGLPKSFLNRFTKVYIDTMTKDDLRVILQAAFPQIGEEETITKMIRFNNTLHNEIVLENKWGRKGGPWEFNVRDLMRWCELVMRHKEYTPGDFINLIYVSRMRNVEDKAHVLALYKKIFDDYDISERTLTRSCQFKVTTDCFNVGYSQLSRRICTERLATRGEDYQFMRYQFPYLEVIMKCVEMNWMSILVGSESSGKNAMVALVAKLCGQSLRVLSMNSGMDTTDFIGGFEQVNLSEDVKNVCRVSLSCINRFLVKCGRDVTRHAEKLLCFANLFEDILEGRRNFEDDEHAENIVEHIENVIGQLKLYLSDAEGMIDDVECIENSLNEVRKKWERNKDRKGVFQWVDSVLVECLKSGHWLLIENVNFCSSSILDRLNGLLEPNGVLTVDERGAVNGEIPNIRPHKDFRLFMSMDPRFGEISRAMRNRGVEIYIPSQSDGVKLDDIDTGLLIKSVLSDRSDAVKYLQEVFNNACKINENVKISSLIKASSLSSVLISNGENKLKAVQKACMEIFCCNEKQLDRRDQLKNCIISNNSNNLKVEDVTALLPSLGAFNQSTTLAMLKRVCLPLFLSNVDEIETLALYNFVLSFERILQNDRGLGLDYMTRICRSKSYIDISKVYNENQPLSFSKDSTICTNMNDISNIDNVKLARRYFFLLLQWLKGFNNVLIDNGKIKSVMSMSKDFDEGHTSAVRLPHQSVMYFYRLCKHIVDFTEKMWNNGIEIESFESFAQFEDAYSWFNFFLEFCRRDLSTSSFSSQLFYVNKFSLHWKWVYEKFFRWFGEKLPNEVRAIVKQVDTLLGHDTLTYVFHDVVSAFGIPKGYLFDEQAYLVETLSDMYSCVATSQGEVFDTCQAKVVQTAKYILLSSSFSQEMEDSVHLLKSEISNNSLPESYDSKLVNVTHRSLFALCSQQVACQMMLNQQNIDSKELQELYSYGFVSKTTGLNSLVCWSILCDHYEKQDSAAVTSMMPFLNLSLYDTNFQHVSSLFGESTEKDEISQRYISPCAPLLSMIKSLNKSESSGLQLRVSLNDVTNTLETLKKFHTMLWSNMNVILAGQRYFTDSFNLLSLLHVLYVLQGFGVVLKNESLVEATRNTLLQLKTMDLYNDEVRGIIRQFLQSITNYRELPDSVKSILSCLRDILVDKGNSEDYIDGSIPCLCGLLLFDVTKAAILKYDPIEELQQRLSYLQKELSCVEVELRTRYRCEHIWSGVPPIDLTSDEAIYMHLTSNPERVRTLLCRRKLLLDDIQSIEKRYAARPSLSQYNAMYQDFEHFSNSIGNRNHIFTQLKEINDILKVKVHTASNLKTLIYVFKKTKTWVDSVNRFTTKLQSSYPLYRDITLYPILSMKHCVAGFNILLKQIKKRIFEVMFIVENKITSYPNAMYPSDVFHVFCNASVQLPKQVLKTLLDHNFLSVCKCISSGDPATNGNLVPSVLNFALLNLRDDFHENLVVLKVDRDESFTCLREIINQYYMLWQHGKQEEAEEQRRKDSLYKFKTQLHCDDKTDEEKAAEMQKSLFPSFDHAFSDLVKMNDLEDGCRSDEAIAVDEEITKTLEEVDECLLYRVVKEIYLKRCREEGRSNKNMMTKYINQALLLLKLPQVHTGIEYEKTAQTVFLMLSSMIQQITPSEDKAEKGRFSIYVNYDIPESIAVKDMLLKFRKYIHTLLEEFEDHPALLHIDQVIQRILSFSISSPVMKFLTGLEFLLKEAQNWETYAGSHVSLRKYLEEITNRVIKWRKLELNCWPQLLEQCEEKISRSTCKWFFHFYNLLQDLRKEENGKDDLVAAMKQFLEHSTVGDFKERMELIQVVLKNIEINGFDQGVQNVLWNIFMYYRQFLPIVVTYMMEKKKPIEKELKDYVKIAKWNDINFYAMKQAVDKSHRTLNKFVRKYEQILLEPIEQFLKDPKSVSSIPPFDIANGFHLCLPDRPVVQEVYTLEEVEGELYVNKVNKLEEKMKKHIKNIVKKTEYGALVENLDGFTGDIVSGIKELQDVDILKLPKEKQKAARNYLQQRKRKALATLFKEMKTIGLSYRKGISMIDNDKMGDLPKLEETQCARMNSALPLQEMITSCNECFYKCQAKQSIFFTALCSPSKEVGPREINRFKGLTEHLLYVACDQRKELNKLLCSHARIGMFIHCANNIKDQSQDHNHSILPPQKLVKKCLCDFELLVKRTWNTLKQFKLLLDSSPPAGDPDNNVTVSPFLPDNLPKIAGCRSNDHLLQNVKETVSKQLVELSSLKKDFCKLNINEMEYPLLHWGDWRFIESSVSSLKGIVETLDDIIPLFSSPRDSNSLSMVDDVKQVREDVLEFAQSFLTLNINDKQDATTSSKSKDSLMNEAESCIQQMLISIQNVKKCADNFADKLKDDENVMKGGHLVPLLTTHFHSHINLLDMQALNKSVDEMLSNLENFHIHIDENNQKAFLNVSAVMQLFFDLIEYYVFNLIVLHRTTCKLLFVLYGLFTDLVQQGYCIPPEEEGEVSGEGATEFEDIENAGLGEGEGVKDVSDQIESEDQVEETKQEGSEEKEKEEGEDIAEEKEGIEMTDDFDGNLQDLELNDEDSSDEEEENEENEEAEKQMGEVDKEQQETIDEKMWGDSDEEEDGDGDDDEKEEEKGPGAEAKSESQLVAKDDNEGEQEGDDDEKKKKEKSESEENKLEGEMDDADVDDEVNKEKKDENRNDENEIQQGEEDIPEDLELDKNEADEGEEEQVPENDDNTTEEIPDEDDDNNEDASDEKEDMIGMEKLEEEQQEKMEEGEDDEQKTDNNAKDKDLPSDNQNTDDNIECAPDDVTTTSTFESTTQQQQQSQENDASQGLCETESELNDGSTASSDVIAKDKPSEHKGRKRKDIGHSKDARTLETSNIDQAKRRKALDADEGKESQDKQERCESADMFQHIEDESAAHDQLIIDAATQDQLNQLTNPQNIPKVESDVDMDDDEEENEAESKSREMEKDVNTMEQADMKGLHDEDHKEEDDKEKEEEDEEMESLDDTIPKDITSGFFTSQNLLLPFSSIKEREEAMEKLRERLESELVNIVPNTKEVSCDSSTAMELWLNYERLTTGLAQQLCEQLRLVLEPTLASKMKGDYRSGKRLNMRKVIPYVASQFRKDKIWLRRTRKSKRQYQIVVAVDDSSSMADNHSKQLAFESLAVISNALQWLEAGDLAVCSFGEKVRLVHSFDETFSEQAGASILQQFTFAQKNTKIAQLLDMCTILLNDTKWRRGRASNVSISQLLLIVSDGRGVFLEGKETVEKAVRDARDAGVFIVFLIMDDPKNKDSILDIKVPVFKPGGGLPQIKSYIEDFPFPFYVLLRDINSLPHVLSDALKQWFELVTQPT